MLCPYFTRHVLFCRCSWQERTWLRATANPHGSRSCEGCPLRVPLPYPKCLRCAMPSSTFTFRVCRGGSRGGCPSPCPHPPCIFHFGCGRILGLMHFFFLSRRTHSSTSDPNENRPILLCCRPLALPGVNILTRANFCSKICQTSKSFV